jgi:hypothetical protein
MRLLALESCRGKGGLGVRENEMYLVDACWHQKLFISQKYYEVFYAVMVLVSVV